jgi:hypothetical protein
MDYVILTFGYVTWVQLFTGFTQTKIIKCYIKVRLGYKNLQLNNITECLDFIFVIK